MNIQIDRLFFEYITNIQPETNEAGRVMEFKPQEMYDNEVDRLLHGYGEGPFCAFSIPHVNLEGVYVLLVNDRVYYVGECKDLDDQFNNGYGSISPEYCFIGGQPTSCRINAQLLQKLYQGADIKLLFHHTNNRKQIKEFIIERYKPEWNLHQHTTNGNSDTRSLEPFFIKTQGKYGPLYDYLEGYGQPYEYLTFEEINHLLQATLPHSSTQHHAWWANDRSHTQGRAWLDAGYRVKASYLGEYVVFEAL
ncbi:GIY-YIG nuclease family protein [Pontibacillus yanchengensis]|uniref:GIY-YIG nuclease family protein n=1 Tax=Pontibacillus yanchengensis TaxID=462910 RepID=UPI00068F986F|nr:GIY-YIG nuclease family protein [Pontibacillus yanchengensis]